ncbi:unnamed protein product, partial [Brenthis ino]
MSILRQTYCTLLLCLQSLNISLIYAWPSSTLKLFASTGTTLNRPMTDTELALLGSLSSISPLLSTPLSAFLLDKLGRKYTTILCAMPQVVAWALISVFSRVEVILFSVFIGGFGGCMFLVIPNYISEICQETIRGTLTSGAIISYGVGLMVSYILGGNLTYHNMNYACLALVVIGVLLLNFVKETPTYLMKKGLDNEAAKSIAFYRSQSPSSKEVAEEMNVLRRALNPVHESVPEEEKLQTESQVKEKLSILQFIKKSQSTRRGLVIILGLYVIAICQGLTIVQVYSEPLFEEALPSVSANLTSVLFAVTNTIAGIFAAYLLDFWGRRPVMIYSSIGTGLCCIALGAQIQLHWGPHWLTAVLIYTFCITCTCGAGTVPYVMIAELFLPEVKSVMSMIAVEFGWICNFLILFIFNPLVSAVGLGPIFYVFAFISVFSTVFSILYLPETKGLTVDIIQTLLVPKKRLQRS